jgi:hypothetical protein
MEEWERKLTNIATGKGLTMLSVFPRRKGLFSLRSEENNSRMGRIHSFETGNNAIQSAL